MKPANPLPPALIQAWAFGVLGLGLLLRTAWAPHPPQRWPPPGSTAIPPRRGLPPGRFERALQAAAHYRGIARAAVILDMEAPETAAPDASAPPEIGLAPEAWRLRQTALDRGDYLARARTFAECAARLARTPSERLYAAELLVMIEREAGHPVDELHQARLLVMLQPGNDAWHMLLRRATARVGTRPATPTSRRPGHPPRRPTHRS